MARWDLPEKSNTHKCQVYGNQLGSLKHFLQIISCNPMGLHNLINTWFQFCGSGVEMLIQRIPHPGLMRKDDSDNTDQEIVQTSIRCISRATLLWFHICFPRPPSISCLKIPAQHYLPKCWKFFSCFSASDHLKGIFRGAWANIRPEMKFPLRLGKRSHRGDNGGSRLSTRSFSECQYQLRNTLLACKKF